MKKFVYILLAFGIMGLTACEKSADDSGIVNTQEGYAELTISLNTPSLQVSTRTLASDPKNQGGSWTTWEKFVDGALLYHVTIFVVKDGTLVAYRDFYSESSDIKAEDAAEGGNGFYETSAVNISASTGTAVKATFTSAAQMHGDIERLTPGDYKVIAVANYAPIESDGNSYAGLGVSTEDDNATNGISSGGDNDFTNIVKSILENFNKSSGLNDFTQTGANGSAFFTYKLNSGTDRVCKQLPQPLVMIRNVTLSSGKNQLTGLLSRTFARVRLEVKRTDVNDVFAVHDLEFQNSYASQNAYLFNDVKAGTGVNLYDHFSLFGTINDNGTVSDDGTAGPLDETSDDCIIPASGFTFHDNETNEYVMLDCYILEGRVKADYAFSFTATYWAGATGGTATENYRIGAFSSFMGGKDGNEQMTGLSEVNVYIHDESVGTGMNVSESSLPKYLLYSDTENIYSTTGDMVTSEELDDVGENADLDPIYIWRINLVEKDGYPKYENFTLDANGNIANGSANPGIGVAYGNLLSIGSGLYLQPYSGQDTPTLGTESAELIFRINFKGNCEVGTVFCNVNGNYYYLDCDNHVLSWKQYTGTESTILGTSTDTNYLTFSTIGGSQGTTTNITINKPISTSVNGSSSTGYNEIRRNDFYYGIIPISL